MAPVLLSTCFAVGCGIGFAADPKCVDERADSGFVHRWLGREVAEAHSVQRAAGEPINQLKKPPLPYFCCNMAFFVSVSIGKGRSAASAGVCGLGGEASLDAEATGGEELTGSGEEFASFVEDKVS